MVTEEDFKTHLYAELIDAIDRNEPTILLAAIKAAEGEAAGYLSRFDLDALFLEVGDDRDATLLMYLKDMAVWHFITLANPDTDISFRKTRYEDAKEWLKGIQAGKIVPKDWPLAGGDAPESYFHVSSSPKRPTRW